jgi:DNA-binding NarL/FixJ family response regulator
MERTVESTLVHIARVRLVNDYPSQINACLDELDDQQVWWRPDERSNAWSRRFRSRTRNKKVTVVLRRMLELSTGRTNKEIAKELSVSEQTIDRHVTNILTKLDVRSRTAAITYAFDHKLF